MSIVTEAYSCGSLSMDVSQLPAVLVHSMLSSPSIQDYVYENEECQSTM